MARDFDTWVLHAANLLDCDSEELLEEHGPEVEVAFEDGMDPEDFINTLED